MLTTYIINLEKSTTRRDYMSQLLEPYRFLDIKFIKAADGRLISDEEMAKIFDSTKCIKRYGREMNKGEKGCALSHRKAMQALLESKEKYALILEDDIQPVGDLSDIEHLDLDSILDCETPTVMFLSGDFWFTTKRGPIAKVYTAVGAYAYLINRQAAEKILSIKTPYSVSDDWTLYKRSGIKYYGVIPYMIDANLKMDLLGSDVDQYSWGINRKKMSISNIMQMAWDGIVKRALKYTGHFESKVRVLDGKITP